MTFACVWLIKTTVYSREVNKTGKIVGLGVGIRRLTVFGKQFIWKPPERIIY
jgi:hypothetical protein